VDVSAFWDTLSSATRTKLVESAPRLVGGLDGFPASVRNVSNRSWVSSSIDALKAKMGTVAGRALAESDQQTLHMLTRVDAALKPTKNGPARTLLSVDPSGEGKAVIVLGNLQTADYVTYMVPGMFFTVDGQLSAWTGDAADLYKQQNAWLHRLAKVDPSAAHKTVAVVAWLGYQTPDLTNIGSLALADQARDALAHDVEAMQAMRPDNEPYTTIVAHSYGSTAALMALTQYDFRVNALVLVGTPGSAAQSAKDLHVDNTNVWVGSAAWDPVPTSAFFGSDPSSPSYGAHKMGVNGGRDIITGKPLAQSLGHNEYFDPNTESIRNMALIAIDQSKLVMRDDAADAHRTLALAK
jgi:pimeloyl-ACP methyl ester carboxylesterase